ncbi:MAG: putative toxin-antitoxin system toxin component, PIN family [Candidatus Binatia bacterium]
MRVFLDTNVLASAAATRGLCADVLREVLASHELLTSAQVLSELRRVLRTKFVVDRDLIDDFIWLMRQDTVLARPGQLPGVKIQDQDDLPILSAAISAEADVFVTGDKEILYIGRIDKLVILSPRQFWEKLKAQPQHRAGRRKPRRSR